MSAYAYRGRAPRALTDDEVTAVLRATGQHSSDLRDHLLVSLAVGTGLREFELAALDVIDIVPCASERSDRWGVRRRIILRRWKGSARAKPGQDPPEVILPDECRRKLALWLWRLRNDDGSVTLTQPLFPTVGRRYPGTGRISTRQIRAIWRKWQLRVGAERVHPFHALRHTYVTRVYKLCRDPILTARLARHARLETTLLYAHLSEEEIELLSRALPA